MNAQSHADAGLFGPDSLTWRVHGEPIMWIAGLRALLLQALHPAARAGVLDHSDFRADPWGRLIRTANYVGVVSFGSTAEVDAISARVRGIHRRVRGTDPVTGVQYDATDPALLAWVHCCEVESFVTTYQRAGGRLTSSEVDAYYAEQVRAAGVVGLRAAEVPGSAEEIAAYFARLQPELAADERARDLARYVLAPPMPRWLRFATPAGPGWAGLALTAASLLPQWARRLYGAPALGVTDRAATAGVRALRLAIRMAPAERRTGPHLRAARQRLGLTAR